MVLHRLRLLSFRAHADTEVHLAPGVNLLLGPNGTGKTNVLEAAHYLCLSKSFLSARDDLVLQRDRPFLEVHGTVQTARRGEQQARVVYVPKEGKRAFINGAPLERLTDLVGRFPVVSFSSEDAALTAGGPSERRRFLDNLLSQASPRYMADLLSYRRALKQRNELLSSLKGRSAPADAALLASWDAELVGLGARVIHRRHSFLREFEAFLERAYRLVQEATEHPTIRYRTVGELPDEATEEDAAGAFRDKLDDVARGERRRGVTLAGPHRDELVFSLNDLPVREYASQGQHRTFGLALKLAQAFYLHDQLDEAPLLLLDDVFDTLDRRRTEAFLNLLQSDAVGQSLVTAARPEPFYGLIDLDGATHRLLRVEPTDAGPVVEEDDALAAPQRFLHGGTNSHGEGDAAVTEQEEDAAVGSEPETAG